MTVSRRDFLTGLGAGMAGYSVLVDARDLLPAADAAELTPEEIRSAFETIAPHGAERFAGEPNMRLVDLKCDLLVAGGGPRASAQRWRRPGTGRRSCSCRTGRGWGGTLPAK